MNNKNRSTWEYSKIKKKPDNKHTWAASINDKKIQFLEHYNIIKNKPIPIQAKTDKVGASSVDAPYTRNKRET